MLIGLFRFIIFVNLLFDCVWLTDVATHQFLTVRYTVSQKNCAFLFLSELCQISTSFNKFW